MEQRIANLILQSPGGNASAEAKSYKLALPSSWVAEMGLGVDNRQVVLSFDGDSITIRKPLNISAFLNQGQTDHCRLLLLSYFYENTLCTKIAVNLDAQRICAENFVDNPIHTAFGNNLLPTWTDFQQFLESRCIPRERAGLQDYLDALGLEEYEPLDIIRKTEGRMAEDPQWIKVEDIA